MPRQTLGGSAPKPPASPPNPLSGERRGGIAAGADASADVLDGTAGCAFQDEAPLLHVAGEGAGGMRPGVTGVPPVILLERARQFRKEPTPSEDRLWQALRRGACGGLKFRRQQPLERFIVDFFCAERRLVIEVDGPIHDHQKERDQERQAILEATGLHLLRFTSRQVMQDLPAVLANILRVAEQLPLEKKP